MEAREGLALFDIVYFMIAVKDSCKVMGKELRVEL